MDTSTLSHLQPLAQSHARSFGLKLFVICALALFMAIPALFVALLVQDRAHRARTVTDEISQHVGGPQTFLGPTLAVPYTIPPAAPTIAPSHGVYLVFPARGAASLTTTIEERHRSLFKVPVFQADVQFDATFDLAGVPASAPQGAVFDWSRAEIVVGATDAHGAMADPTLTANGKTVTLVPAQILDTIPFGPGDKQRSKLLTLFGAPLSAFARPNTAFRVSSRLQFSGAEHIAVLAYGKTTEVTAHGDWPHPGFDGGLLPAMRNITNTGFQARWSVPFAARGVRAEGPADSLTGLESTALGVSFVEVADAYQSVTRALKYAPLFLGLIFLSYFVFEVTTSKRVHPAQYILVGIAQLVFYVLLLSFSERIGFDLGFLLAGCATVTLLSVNAQWVFASRREGVRAFCLFAPLYGVIYTLLRLEDNALIVGALASFAAVTAAMYFTRRIDWYSSSPATGGSAPAMPLSPGSTA